jgi:hypothetical protein
MRAHVTADMICPMCNEPQKIQLMIRDGKMLTPWDCPCGAKVNLATEFTLHIKPKKGKHD